MCVCFCAVGVLTHWCVFMLCKSERNSKVELRVGVRASVEQKHMEIKVWVRCRSDPTLCSSHISITSSLLFLSLYVNLIYCTGILMFKTKVVMYKYSYVLRSVSVRLDWAWWWSLLICILESHHAVLILWTKIKRRRDFCLAVSLQASLQKL